MSTVAVLLLARRRAQGALARRRIRAELRAGLPCFLRHNVHRFVRALPRLDALEQPASGTRNFGPIAVLFPRPPILGQASHRGGCAGVL
jgi:hypothetical protein